MATRSRSYAAFAVCLSILMAAPAGAAQPGPGSQRTPPRATQPTAESGEPGGNQRAVRDDRANRFGNRTGDLDEANAQDARRRLQNLLRQYPPSLAEVLRLDPSLLTNEAYLAPYPALVAFLSQHAEVAHNPGYFIGEFRFSESQPDRERIRAWQGVLEGFEVLLGITAAIGILASIVKSLIDYRRWLVASRSQNEVHAKLMDRLTSNEDLLAYMQSPVGRRYLEAAPIPLDAGPRPIAAPVGRILWSVQAGFVAAAVGAALLYGSARMAADAALSDVAPPLFLVGMIGLAIGIGFILSAVVAYLLSHRLGLFERQALTPHA